MNNSNDEHNEGNSAADYPETADKREAELIQAYSDLLGAPVDPQMLKLLDNLDLLHNSDVPPAELYFAKPWLSEAFVDASPPSTSPASPVVSTRSRKTEYQNSDYPTTAMRSALPSVPPAQRLPIIDRNRISVLPSVLAGGPRRGGYTVAGIVLVLVLAAGLVVLLNQRSGGHMIPNTALAPTLSPENYPLLDAKTTLTQKVAGYTFTLGPLPQYGRTADANTIILPYNVTDSAGTFISQSAVQLADSNGQNAPQLLADGKGEQALSWLGTTEEQSNWPGMGGPVPGYTVMVFDANALLSHSGQVMQLTVNLHISDNYRSRQFGQPVPTPTSPGAATTTAGPFVFHFRLPIDPLRSVASVNEKVTSNGISLSLEEVVATSWEARLILSFQSPDGGPVTRWQPTDALLSGSGIERVTVAPVRSSLANFFGAGGQQRLDGWLDDGRWAGSAFRFAGASDFMVGGSWTLVVGALTSASADSTDNIGNSPPQRIAGPWIFHFTMPPFEPRPTPVPYISPVPGFIVPPPPPTSETHEPFPTVALPGPWSTVPAQAGENSASATPRATIVPMSVETVQVLATAASAYATAYGLAPYDTPLPTPGDGASAPLQLGNLHSLTMDPQLASEDLDATNPPALSPDGESMLVGTRDHRLLLARLDGSDAITLSDDVTSYAWSADGLYVVYLHMEPMGSPSFIQVPYSVTRDGKKRQRLDFASSNVGLFPEITRGGAWELRDGAWLWRVPLDGGKAEQVLSTPNASYGNPFRIAPDEGRMAYPCQGANGGLCMQNMDGSNWISIDVQPYDMAWSLDGSILAVTSGRQITLIARDGTLLRKITQDAPFDEITLQWAANSRYLLVYVGRIAATGQQRLEEVDTSTGQVWLGPAPASARSFITDFGGQHLLLRGGAAEFQLAELVAR